MALQIIIAVFLSLVLLVIIFLSLHRRGSFLFYSGLFGGLYALLPFLGFIYWWAFATSGDPGPAFVISSPLFYPHQITFSVAGIFLTPLVLIGDVVRLEDHLIEVVLNVVNIILWSLIGASVGYFLKKKKLFGRKRK